MRGGRRPWIIWPGMARVATLELFLYFGIGALPEAPQILRHLHWLLPGRQQMQYHGYAALGNAWRVGQAKQFLQLHCQQGRLTARVVQFAAHAAGHGDLARRMFIDCAPLRIIQPYTQRLAEIFAGQLAEFALALQRR